MKKSLKFYLFTLVLITSIGCGKQTLTPFVNPMTVNELRNDQPVNFTYKIDETEIDEYARDTGKFPIFGKLFKTIAVVLANSTISSKEGHVLKLDPVDVDLESLEGLDFDYIDWIKFNSLLLTVQNAKKKDSLDFINKLELYAKINEKIEGAVVDDDGFTRLVYFDNDIHALECAGRCLNLRIEKINWKELLQNNKKIQLKPKLVINSVPQSTMALAGSVTFSVKFKLGF